MHVHHLPYTELDLKSVAVFPEANFAVSSQANSFVDALANLKKMSEALGITAEISESDFQHYVKGEYFKWFTRNPLMLVRLASNARHPFENQFVYMLKIRTSAALVVMLHALSEDAGLTVENRLSSAAVNN